MTTLLTYNMGVQAFEERDYKTAVERFSSVLEADPGNTNVREYLARAHFHRAAFVVGFTRLCNLSGTCTELGV